MLFRDLLNAVLRGLGEDEVESTATELTDDYHLLIALFVNQIKEEVEAAHNWRDLATEHTATVTAGSTSGVIVDANGRSRLSYMNSEQGSIPLVFDITDPSNPIPLTEVPLAALRYRQAMDPDGSNIEPTLFSVASNGDGTLSIHVYPEVTTERTIVLTMFTPQPRLEYDDLDVYVKVPTRAIELGAIWYGMEERGEELGTNSLFTEERFRKALADTIATDGDAQGVYELQIV